MRITNKCLYLPKVYASISSWVTCLTPINSSCCLTYSLATDKSILMAITVLNYPATGAHSPRLPSIKGVYGIIYCTVVGVQNTFLTDPSGRSCTIVIGPGGKFRGNKCTMTPGERMSFQNIMMK